MIKIYSYKIFEANFLGCKSYWKHDELEDLEGIEGNDIMKMWQNRDINS